MAYAHKREFQRLRLAKPIMALLDDENALILDIGIRGAFVEHYGRVPIGSRATLLFRYKAADLGFLCEVIHTDAVRDAANSVVSHTGLRFIEAIGKSERRLTDMVATMVGRILAAQRANAAAKASASDNVTLDQMGAAHRSRSRNYLTYRLGDGVWSRAFTDSPDQPEDGFTVAGFEDENELQTLCDTYAAGDEEGRRLIRLVAELSARAVKK